MILCQSKQYNIIIWLIKFIYLIFNNQKVITNALINLMIVVNIYNSLNDLIFDGTIIYSL